MDKTILECALKRNWNDSTPVKILSIEDVPAIGKNLNFLSTVSRVSLKVVLGNGRVAKRSFITKTATENEWTTEFGDKYCTFQTETKIYNTLTQLEYLMEDFEDTEDILWGKMIYHTTGVGASIVMEDLKAKGFHMIEREMFYDLEHILLSVHSLGRYHGMFKTLEERGIMSPQGLKPWYLFDSEKMHEYMYWDVCALARSIKKLWDPSWIPIVEKINISKNECLERLKKFCEVDETKFNVINHGDCHKNNILIKYNWEKRPIALRFVDFQLVHYGSPCADLTYMIYLATIPSVRRENFDLILRTYYDSLMNTLDKYQFNGNKPSLDEIKEGMEKHSFLALLLSLSWYPTLIKSEQMEELKDLKKIETTDGMEGYADGIFEPDGLEDDIGPDIKAFVNKFCSDSLDK